MPTSATGISTEADRGARLGGQLRAATAARSAHAGFSLLELLVVVTIIGLFAGAAVLSIGIAGDDRTIEREASRLQTLLGLVREEALMQSRDFGVLFAADGYRFYVYDHLQRRWVEPPGDRLLARHGLEAPLQLELRVEDRALALEHLAAEPEGGDGDESSPAPQVLILSSGEMTPFEVSIQRELRGGRLKLTGGLDGRLELSDEELARP